MFQPQLSASPGQVFEQRKPTRPTRKEIRDERWFGIRELATQAEVAPAVVAAMRDQRPIGREQAYKVLVALTKMHWKLYTVRDVDVAR
jgi:hypothetical protein